MSDRHKVFVSYHHAADQAYKDRFVQLFSQVVVDWSVRLGDIADGLATETIRQKIRDEWLRDATVTVVLVGRQTWQRKHVDWEIGSSLRNTSYNPRSGLLGILLPTYPAPQPGFYEPTTIPPRLADNLGAVNSFARIYPWTENPGEMQRWIHDAFVRRNQEPPPNNSRDSFRNNRSGDRWAP
jgi:hypothetical protein